MNRALLGIAVMTLAALTAMVVVASPMPAGDAVHGAAVYQICTGCHSLDEDDVGPRHRGVVGRKAGSIEGYAYSPALKNSGVTWTPEALDHWLENPQALVPGTKMFFALKDAKDRADVIAYLADQK